MQHPHIYLYSVVSYVLYINADIANMIAYLCISLVGFKICLGDGDGDGVRENFVEDGFKIGLGDFTEFLAFLTGTGGRDTLVHWLK